MNEHISMIVPALILGIAHLLATRIWAFDRHTQRDHDAIQREKDRVLELRRISAMERANQTTEATFVLQREQWEVAQRIQKEIEARAESTAEQLSAAMSSPKNPGKEHLN